MRGIIWFREDLRITDNTALLDAMKICTSGVIAVYIIDKTSWKNHDVAPCRVQFILQGVKTLQLDLQMLNIPLLCIEVKKTAMIPKKMAEIMHELCAQALFFNRQYELDEGRRDRTVECHLREKKLACYSYDDQTILPPNMIKTKQGGVYKIFTPFKQTWLQVFAENKMAHFTLLKPKPQKPLAISSAIMAEKINGFTSSVEMDLWPAGENNAIIQLKSFIRDKLFQYDKWRDYPAAAGTSKLSPYLAAGMLSPRQCFHEALAKNHGKLASGNRGALTWMSELIWRDYYKHLLAATPRLSMNKPYHLNTDRLPWCDNQELLTAWQKGNTGFPIIDAAMRQLNTTAWMHNRLRMVVAMFLVRHLFLDWRLGEKYFMQHLIDGDLAANNGGWQWCAATGADAAPYFRVFNPIRQSERFDPEGKFIRTYCPELQDLDNKQIHDPWTRAPQLMRHIYYPQPIVDLETGKQKFIAAFKQILA